MTQAGDTATQTTIVPKGDSLPSNMQRIYLVRHAHAWDETKPPQMDPELTGMGKKQAGTLKDAFSTRPVDLVVTSELQRAQATADVIRQSHPGVRAHICPGLNEFHTVGDWRSYGPEEVRRLVSTQFSKPDFSIGFGETSRQFRRRIRETWEEILSSRARNIAIVSHGGVLAGIVALAFGFSEEAECGFAVSFPNASVSELLVADTSQDPDLPDRVTIIRYLSDTQHIPPELVTR